MNYEFVLCLQHNKEGKKFLCTRFSGYIWPESSQRSIVSFQKGSQNSTNLCPSVHTYIMSFFLFCESLWLLVQGCVQMHIRPNNILKDTVTAKTMLYLLIQIKVLRYKDHESNVKSTRHAAINCLPHFHPAINCGLQLHPALNCGLHLHSLINCWFHLHPAINCGLHLHPAINCGLLLHPAINCGLHLHSAINCGFLLHPAIIYELLPYPCSLIKF